MFKKLHFIVLYSLSSRLDLSNGYSSLLTKS